MHCRTRKIFFSHQYVSCISKSTIHRHALNNVVISCLEPRLYILDKNEISAMVLMMAWHLSLRHSKFCEVACHCLSQEPFTVVLQMNSLPWYMNGLNLNVIQDWPLRRIVSLSKQLDVTVSSFLMVSFLALLSDEILFQLLSCLQLIFKNVNTSSTIFCFLILFYFIVLSLQTNLFCLLQYQ